MEAIVLAHFRPKESDLKTLNAPQMQAKHGKTMSCRRFAMSSSTMPVFFRISEKSMMNSWAHLLFLGSEFCCPTK